MIQYSPYAFIPFGILFAIALIGTCISHWPQKRRPANPRLAILQRPTAEILHFPLMRNSIPTLRPGRARNT